MTDKERQPRACYNKRRAAAYREPWMKRERVLRMLRRHHDELVNQFGVKALTLFGSVARDEADATSDVDLLVEFVRPTGYFGLVRLQLCLQQLLGAEVDLATSGSVRPAMRQRIAKEAPSRPEPGKSESKTSWLRLRSTWSSNRVRFLLRRQDSPQLNK